MNKRSLAQKAHKKALSFAYLSYSAFSLLLLCTLVMLPLAPAFASSELSGESTPSANPSATNQSPIQDETSIVNTQPSDTTVNESSNQTNGANQQEPLLPVSDPSAIQESTEKQSNIDPLLGTISSEVESVPSVPSDEPLDDFSFGAEDISSSTSELDADLLSTSTDEGVNTTNDTELPLSTESTSTQETNSSEVVSTTTLPTATSSVSVNTLINDENRFSFSKNECMQMGNGMFYCIQSTSTPTVTQTDRIFSAVDAEGDKEIYVEKQGEIVAITNNNFDDDAPYYDEISNTAVWHRLIDGRYQIMLYDFKGGKETQLTHDLYNNMQPSRYGDVIAWQGWVGNDWEIFLLDNGQLEMITDNTTQDIAPSINESHVVWQSFENGTWSMKLYDVRTKQIQTVEDAEGGAVKNPRFVLVYDRTSENGDTETKGFDLKSGKTISLGVEPNKVPREIPDPDQTGEKRALVNPLNQSKPKTEDDGDDLSSGSSTPPVALVNGGESISDDASSTPSTINMVVPPDNTATSSVAHIEDIIVPPYGEGLSSTTDSH